MLSLSTMVPASLYSIEKLPLHYSYLLLFLPYSLVGAYKVGLDLQVEFEFRTTQTNGVLLGISSQKMDGLGIELVDENVSMELLGKNLIKYCFSAALKRLYQRILSHVTHPLFHISILSTVFFLSMKRILPVASDFCNTVEVRAGGF